MIDSCWCDLVPNVSFIPFQALLEGNATVEWQDIFGAMPLHLAAAEVVTCFSNLHWKPANLEWD